MKGLREELEGSVVFKHHDASMVGLVDCSVTWGGRTMWLEFKLYEWQEWMTGKTTYDIALRLVAKARKAAPVQWECANKLDAASKAFYVIWVKKSFVLLVNPSCGEALMARYERTTGIIGHIAAIMRSWSQVSN